MPRAVDVDQMKDGKCLCSICGLTVRNTVTYIFFFWKDAEPRREFKNSMGIEPISTGCIRHPSRWPLSLLAFLPEHFPVCYIHWCCSFSGRFPIKIESECSASWIIKCLLSWKMWKYKNNRGISLIKVGDWRKTESNWYTVSGIQLDTPISL